MAVTIANLLTDFSPAAHGEALGINVLRTPKLPVETSVKHVEPEPPPSKVDRQAELIKLAEARVRAEERSAAGRRIEEALAAEKARYEEDLAVQRKIWAEHEAMQLSSQFVESLMRLETVLSERVANVLRPFVSQVFHEQAVAEFKEVLSTILLGRDGKHIKVTGPADLLSAIESEFAGRETALEFLPADQVEVSLTARDTSVETQLASWAGRLEKAFEAER